MKKIKYGLHVIRFNISERWFDFVNLLVPVFVVTGLIATCIKFWAWLYWGI